MNIRCRCMSFICSVISTCAPVSVAWPRSLQKTLSHERPALKKCSDMRTYPRGCHPSQFYWGPQFYWVLSWHGCWAQRIICCFKSSDHSVCFIVFFVCFTPCFIRSFSNQVKFYDSSNMFHTFPCYPLFLIPYNATAGINETHDPVKRHMISSRLGPQVFHPPWPISPGPK